jgi:signal transduction histidine kinase
MKLARTIDSTDSLLIVRLLLVEDSALDAELLLDELAGDGLRVEHEIVETEPAFVEALQRFAPDIIVSDISMPDFSGYRALDIARARAPHLPFVFVSGTMGEEAAVDALRGGAIDYVLKQNVARIAFTLRRALAEAQQRRAREQAEADLVRAQRYESLALLATGLSHDLRNVLQPISMSIATLREDSREEVRRIGQVIGDCTQQGLDIVASMLSFAKGTRTTIHRVGAKALLDGTAVLLRGTIPRNVTLHIGNIDAALEVDGNYTELQQCLLNLCLNALQAMPEGGELKLDAERVALEAAYFAGDEHGMPGVYLRLVVADSGIGMPEHVRAKLFTPFFTTKENGTGLGLLSCRRILGNHRGFLDVASEPGHGTTFSAYLPLPAGAGKGAGPIPRGHGERVLIVVERKSELTLLGDIVELQGYRVTLSENGLMAARSIETDGLPDAVVMEAEMNLATGVKTAAALLVADFRGPMLMIARDGAATADLDLPPLQRIRFIDKPVKPDQLLAVLAEETVASRA